MMLRDIAYKKQFTAGDPSIFGDTDSYSTTQYFRCKWRATAAEQQVRAGRDSTERGIRLWYRPFGIELVQDDKVSVAGRDYDIVYAQPPKSRTGLVYADCKESL